MFPGRALNIIMFGLMCPGRVLNMILFVCTFVHFRGLGKSSLFFICFYGFSMLSKQCFVASLRLHVLAFEWPWNGEAGYALWSTVA